MLAFILETGLRSALLIGLVWLALTALRVRDVRVRAMVWRAALIATILLPLLMPFIVVTVDGRTIEHAKAVFTGPTTVDLSTKVKPSPLWLGGLPLYGAVAALFLLRLAVGLGLTWRAAARAARISENWTADRDIRCCSRISVPVTFADTILLPPDWTEWATAKRQAVLAHETSHVENRDFYWQLLAHANRALFWFNPLAWWLLFEMSRLDELVSDDAAISSVGDRPHYAEVLIAMSHYPDSLPSGLAMARTSGMMQRIDHVLSSVSTSARLTPKKRALIALFTVPLALILSLGITPANANIKMVPPAAAGEKHICLRHYPAEAVKQHHMGRTQLRFVITMSGTVQDISVKKSSGYPELDAASVACVKNWTYRAAKQYGEPVQVWWRADIAWLLHDPKTL